MSKTIMIVEDDLDIQGYYRFLLSGPDVELVMAVSAEEALDLHSKRDDIDLILLDVVLPGLGGEEFYRILRFERQSDIPVVVCSVDSSMAQMVQQVGEVQGVFTKGESGEVLQSLVQGLLGSS